MKTESDRFAILLPAIAGIVAIMLVIGGAARIVGALPNPIGGIGSAIATEVLSAASADPVKKNLPPASDNVRGKWRCPECGVIVAMRMIGASGSNAGIEPARHAPASDERATRGPSAERFEFVVRLQDGSRRVIVDANPASWRLGERVIVIDGTSASQR